MAEHVGEIPDQHGPAERLGPPDAHFEIAHERLAGYEELVHQDPPGADRQLSIGHQPRQPGRLFWAHFEVVVDGCRLAVEGEPNARVAGHLVEQTIDQLHQTHPKRLERQVPLAIPVGVRNEVDHDPRRHRLSMSTAGRHRAAGPATRWYAVDR